MFGKNGDTGFHKRAERLPQAVLKSHFTDGNYTALTILRILWLKLSVKAKSYNFFPPLFGNSCINIMVSLMS